MTAGSVAVPAIVPLKVFSAGGRKNHVDTTTKIELTSGEHKKSSSVRKMKSIK